jgi:cold shock CspA family protein
MRFTGKLKTWTDDRGFGFIAPTEGGQDIFVHISEYPRGRRPMLDETLSFEVALNPQGKKKAVEVRIEPRHSAGSGREASRRRRTERISAGGILRTIVTLAMIVFAAWYGYRQYIIRFSPASIDAARAQSIGLPQSRAPAASSFSCDGRTRCSQMTSCAEATFFLKNCPGTQMDGDHDGIPCEQQLCN